MPSDDLLVTRQRNFVFKEGTGYVDHFYDVNSQGPDPCTV